MRPVSQNHYSPGFTLMQFLVTLAILIMLFALFISSYHSTMATAHSSRCLGNLRQIGAALHLYVAENQGGLPEMSALSDPTNPGSEVIMAQRLLAPYTGIPPNFAWNSNTNTESSFGVWICPADGEPRDRVSPELARWKGMNSYLVNYYVGKSVVDSDGQNTNTRTIERIDQAHNPETLWYFADGIATAGGQGRMSVGMVSAGPNQAGALQLRFRHGNKVNVLYLSGRVGAYEPGSLIGQGEVHLNPRE